MSNLLSLVIVIFLIIFLIHNFGSSIKEIVNLISTLFIRLHKRKQIDSICKAEDHFTNIINSEIMNQHITYINIKLDLIQKNNKQSDEDNVQDCLNDSKNKKISNTKKIYLLPESCNSIEEEKQNLTSKRKKSKAKGE